MLEATVGLAKVCKSVFCDGLPHIYLLFICDNGRSSLNTVIAGFLPEVELQYYFFTPAQ